jgi:hypothetical protein
MRTRFLGAVAVGAVVAVVVVLVLWRLPFQHWLAVHTGTDNEPGGYYGFFSGFGSDLGEVTLVVALFGAWHHVNCHQDGCWRIGKHKVAGTPWCGRHHHAARAAAVPPPEPLEAKLDRLIEAISALAEATRLSLRNRMAADAQVKAGAGDNPAEGLPADQRVVPPAAAPRKRRP